MSDYTSLLPTRDFAYLFGGGLFIFVFQKYILVESTFLEGGNSYLLLFGYLSASYFIGLSLYQAGGKLTKVPFLERIKWNTIPYPHPYENCKILARHILVDKYDKRIINNIERNENLFGVGNTIGACSFFGGFLMLFNWIFRFIISKILPSISTVTNTICYFAIMIILISIGCFMFYFAHEVGKKIEIDLECLLNALKKKSIVS